MARHVQNEASPPSRGRDREGGEQQNSPLRREFPHTVKRARGLRTSLTDAERLLWSRLRRGQLDGFRFRRQVPIGPYIADFACLAERLIIEVDGGQHSSRTVEDTAREQWLADRGYRVIRFWNNDVLENIDGVLAEIRDSLGEAVK